MAGRTVKRLELWVARPPRLPMTDAMTGKALPADSELDVGMARGVGMSGRDPVTGRTTSAHPAREVRPRPPLEVLAAGELGGLRIASP